MLDTDISYCTVHKIDYLNYAPCPYCSPRPMPHSPPKEPTALATQEGGDHYKKMAIQPVEFIHKNGIGFIEGNVIKYVSRWRNKNGIEDLKKARHFIDLLIEMESNHAD